MSMFILIRNAWKNGRWLHYSPQNISSCIALFIHEKFFIEEFGEKYQTTLQI